MPFIETFNKANGPPLGPGLTWTRRVYLSDTEWQVLSNQGLFRYPAEALPPDPVSDITHGEEIPWYSGDAEPFLGVPQPDTLPEIGGVLTGTQHIIGRQINGQCQIRAGADIILENCVLVGSANPGSGSTGATLRLTYGGGAKCEVRNSLIITRAGVNVSGNTKCIGCIGDNHLKLYRCVVRGGLDNCYWSAPGDPGVWVTGDPVIPNARLYIVETWLGDMERVGSGHPDLLQVDGVGRGHVLAVRSRFGCYNIPIGSDTLTTRVEDRATASMGGTCFIATHVLSQSPTNDSHHIALRDSWFEGGNNSTQIGNTLIPPLELTGNLYGLRHNFNAIAGSWSEISDCRWGETGTTIIGGDPVEVTTGELVPGSSP